MCINIHNSEELLLPIGFKAGGAHSGLKKQKNDIAVIVSETPAVTAGCFTTNKAKAAPVVYDIETLERTRLIKGIVINSGNANACTAHKGYEDTKEMAEILGNAIGGETLVCSTGVIGVHLPMEKIRAGIPAALAQIGSDSEHIQAAIDGIMTTDTFQKAVTKQAHINGKTITVYGMAKGSGMIHPNMATMLAFVLTDAGVDADVLHEMLSRSVKDSFNMISVDGDTSTNDTILVLANGKAGEVTDTEALYDVMHAVNKELAIAVARDGEGATKLMEVRIAGAKSEEDARLLAKSVVSSNLFKAALFGADANWGRILCAMGYSGGDFDPAIVTMDFNSAGGCIHLIKDGNATDFDEDEAKVVLSEKDIYIDINLNQGTGCAVAWGCDLTYDYVKINGDYRS